MMKSKKVYLVLLILVFILTSCTLEKGQNPVVENSTEIEKIEEVSQEEAEIEPEPKIETIRIKVFGDIMFHMPQVRYARNPDDTYDFSEFFSEVKDFIQDSDLSIGNFESTTNPNRKLSGFPAFNTPTDVFSSLKDAGFDILSTMNNHSLDTGIEGVISTIDAMESAGIKQFGTKKPGEKGYEIVELKGIKLGILGYTESLNGLDYILDTEEKKSMVNLLIEENVKSDIEKLKELGCDFIIIYPHWGYEYHSNQNSKQMEFAHKMLEWGGDLVIGNHPHVVQPTEIYKTSDGRDGFIAYSCGNFISNQRKETMVMEGIPIVNGERCEQNICYEIVLEKNFDENEKKIKDVIYHPMWVGLRDGDKGRRVVKSHLCQEFIEGGKKFEEIGEQTRARIQSAYDSTLETTKPLTELVIGKKVIDTTTYEDTKVTILSESGEYGDEIKINGNMGEFSVDVTGMNPWKIDFCNIDGGEMELAIGVYKTSPHHDEEVRRVFLYNLDFENQRLKPKFRISRLSNPLVDFTTMDLDNDGLDEIVSIEKMIDGNYTFGGYKWGNFSVEKHYSSEDLNAVPSFSKEMGIVEIEGINKKLFLEGEAIKWN